MRVISSSLQLSLDTDDLMCFWRDVEPFPVVLHRLLGNMAMEGNEHIIAWNDDGESFSIYKPKEFADKILTRYFKNQTRYKSFQRQLNLYRFNRISPVKEKGVYAHKSFLRDFPQLCQFVRRTRKQTRENTSGNQQSIQDTPDHRAQFLPKPLPIEIHLTHSATFDVCSTGPSRIKESNEMKGISTKIVQSSNMMNNPQKDEECPCADVPMFPESSSSLTCMKGIDRSTTTLDRQPIKTESMDRTTDHIHALLATLSPPTASCPSESHDVDDDLSIGSIEGFDTTMSFEAMDLSWACRPADVETIFS